MSIFEGVVIFQLGVISYLLGKIRNILEARAAQQPNEAPQVKE